MKTAPFDYRRPLDLAEASRLLLEHDDACVIAGGQTLIPMMAMRLARPPVLVDIGRIEEIKRIEREGDRLAIGAAVRQALAERSAHVASDAPLLACALPHVGHAPTRNRGTLGGSVANADPAAEIPLVLTTLAGAVRVQRGEVQREIPADDFFQGPMMTALEPGDCVAALLFPVWPEARIGVGFVEISARQSDYAYVSAAAQVALDADGACLRCALGIGGATPVPTRLDAVAQALCGQRLTRARIEAALQGVIEDLEIMTDSHASPAYRQRVAREFAIRALLAAQDDAQARSKRGRP